MKRHFFIKKTNTIIEGSKSNLGFNPILSLTYGYLLSRGLLKIDTEEIREEICKGELSSIDNLKIVLKMTNCSSLIDKDSLSEKRIIGYSDCDRASSFDLILFRLPFDFDQGRGSSLAYDMWYDTKETYTKDGSNWFQARNNIKWKPEEETDLEIPGLSEGIYSISYLKEEFDKFNSGENSIIIASQHFDLGTENLSMDITEEIKNIINGKHFNYGFGLAFSPYLEETKLDYEEYVGFFTDRTNTFFHPFIEVEDNDIIADNRYNFIPYKKNNLNLFCLDNDNFIDLDEIPVCTIDGNDYPVKRIGKGKYIAEIPENSISGEVNDIFYDVWSNLKIDGAELEDEEQRFSIAKSGISFKSVSKRNGVPLISGIHNKEKINRGQNILIALEYIEEYNPDNILRPDDVSLRIYIKDGKDEITVFDYDKLIMQDFKYKFMLYTEDFIPHKYFIDIRVKNGRNIKTHKEVINFEIVSDKTKEFN